jgi:hypothetical protein
MGRSSRRGSLRGGRSSESWYGGAKTYRRSGHHGTTRRRKRKPFVKGKGAKLRRKNIVQQRSEKVGGATGRAKRTGHVGTMRREARKRNSTFKRGSKGKKR